MRNTPTRWGRTVYPVVRLLHPSFRRGVPSENRGPTERKSLEQRFGQTPSPLPKHNRPLLPHQTGGRWLLLGRTTEGHLFLLVLVLLSSSSSSSSSSFSAFFWT